MVGAHSTGYNSTHRGIGYLGYSADVTEAAKSAIKWLIGSRAVVGHRDQAATACPGNELYTWMRMGMPLLEEKKKEEPTLKASDRRLGPSSGDYNLTLFHANREYASAVNDLFRGTLSDEDALALAAEARRRRKEYVSFQAPKESFMRLHELMAGVRAALFGTPDEDDWKARYDALVERIKEVLK